MRTALRKHQNYAGRKLDLAVIALVTVAGSLLFPSLATAAEKPTITVDTVDATALGKATRRASKVGSKEAKLQVRVKGHVDKLARAGRLTDTAQVQVAAVPDPNIAGAEVNLLWDEGKAPHKVTVAKVAEDGKETPVGFGSIFLDTQTDEQVTPAGDGYDYGTAPKNMYRYKYGCIEQYWESTGVDDHYLWSCWEKWAEKGTNHWIYNRFGRFSRADYSWIPYTREFTIRSRPWAGSDAITALNSATPTASATNCEATQTVTLGFTRAGVSGQLGIPLHRCDSVNPVGTWGRKEIGVQFKGKTTKKVLYDDMAGDYTAKDKTVVPSWADYTWAAVDRKYGDFSLTTLDEFVRKDSGW
ncbi:hypothetical protein [Actinoplanes siamensis]|uniref:Uncharacterized protein n=1 Tax=Actinoplanes siamensis TaxID=1223317 RepID=A0A919TNA1_9ACTN|nr:hypothetical protein [Actinoplanes siamensis]GIF08484.1 hypothetical protein Asi03nite_60220 [Actinoplanes siamensis]